MDNKIRSTSIAMLITSLTKCFFLGISMPYIIRTAKNMTIWSFFLGFLLSFGLLFILIKLFNKDPELSLIGKIKKNFSKITYYIISNLVILIGLIMAFILLWELNSFISNEFLSETPTLFILILVCLPIFYITLYNFQVLTRFSLLCFYVGIVIIMFNFLGVAPFFDLSNIGTNFISELSGTIKSAIYFMIVSMGPCFLLTICPKEKIVDKQKFNKTIFWFFIYSSFMFMIIFLGILLSMDANLLSKYTYPEFVVLKMINMFNFLDTVENISAILWFLYLIIATCVCTIFVKNAVIEVYNLESKKKTQSFLSIIIVFIIFALCLASVKYSAYLNVMDIHLYPFYSSLSLIIVSIIILLKSKKKKKAKN